MVCIFYDLETSSLHNTGQIINYCFSAVDDNWREIKCVSGLVRLSCIQLPDPGAVDATKVNVLEHQEQAADSELQAVGKIHEFLKWAKSANGGMPRLIGYNSARFDLEYLRVTFIRNGVSPYGLFEGHDFLLAAEYLYAGNEKFRSLVPTVQKDGKTKISLKLEHVCKSLGLLTGRQLHESAFDVELLIKLAQYCAKEFGLDIRTFQSYALKEYHSLKTPIARTCEFSRTQAGYVRHSWKLFLEQDGSGVFWVDLPKFAESRSSRGDALKAVRRYKITGDLIWDEKGAAPPAEMVALAEEARGMLGKVTSSQLFRPTDCWIEEFIYRIEGGAIPQVKAACEAFPRISEDINPDIKRLAKRYWLENSKDRDSEEYRTSFERYCRFRYGGGLQINNTPEGKSLEPGDFHPTFAQMFAEAKALREASDTPEIFDALIKFYTESDVCQALSRSVSS